MFDWVLNGPETHPNSNQILKPLIFNLATEIGLYFPRVALGGMALGLIAGKFIVFWLQHVFNDAMVEIALFNLFDFLHRGRSVGSVWSAGSSDAGN